MHSGIEHKCFKQVKEWISSSLEGSFFIHCRTPYSLHSHMVFIIAINPIPPFWSLLHVKQWKCFFFHSPRHKTDFISRNSFDERMMANCIIKCVSDIIAPKIRNHTITENPLRAVSQVLWASQWWGSFSIMNKIK